VATTLLVAGSTLTFWICAFASTSSYSNVAQSEDKTLQCSQVATSVSSTHKHQCMTAITTNWTESSWAFPESYAANDSWIMRSSNDGQWVDKRAHNSTTKVSFCTIVTRFCHCMIAITMV